LHAAHRRAGDLHILEHCHALVRDILTGDASHWCNGPLRSYSEFEKKNNIRINMTVWRVIAGTPVLLKALHLPFSSPYVTAALVLA
jgi:hypothetical protein